MRHRWGPQTVSGTLPEAGSEAKFVFNATLGDRFYYDGFPSTLGVTYDVRLAGYGSVFGGEAGTDPGSFRVPGTGSYTLIFHNPTDAGGTFQFRLLRVIDAGVLDFDKPAGGSLPPNQALLFRLDSQPGLKLLFQSAVPKTAATWSLFNKSDVPLSGLYPVSSSLPLITSLERGTFLLVLQNPLPEESPYSFVVVPGNHAPQLKSAAPIVTEEQSLSFTVVATDPEQWTTERWWKKARSYS